MVVLNRICPRCKESFITIRTNKRFCCRICQQRYSSIRSYYKNKDDPEYIMARRETFLRWVRNNKKRYGEFQKVYRLNRLKRELKPVKIKYVTQK